MKRSLKRFGSGIMIFVFLVVAALLIFRHVGGSTYNTGSLPGGQKDYSQMDPLSVASTNAHVLGTSTTSTNPSITSPKLPVSTGCSTYHPCPTNDPPEEQIYQRTPPQETGTGCASTTICPASDDKNCTIQDNCGANPANNDDQQQCTIRDNCGAQQAPDSL